MSFYIPVRRVNAPCEECGVSPALEYELVGIKGVLCETCLNKEVVKVNRAIEETAKEDELKRHGKP